MSDEFTQSLARRLGAGPQFGGNAGVNGRFYAYKPARIERFSVRFDSGPDRPASGGLFLFCSKEFGHRLLPVNTFAQV
ncbi:MAG: hypothetical protein NBV67_02055 [Tagaea sp.]|nr:hypothetical protein [Tagaea sp.]